MQSSTVTNLIHEDLKEIKGMIADSKGRFTQITEQIQMLQGDVGIIKDKFKDIKDEFKYVKGRVTELDQENLKKKHTAKNASTRGK